MLPFAHTIEKALNNFTDTTGVRFKPWPVFIIGLSLLFVAFVFMPSVVSRALSLALFIAPIWLPFLLLGGARSLWLVMKRSEFIARQKYLLLEIKPPRNLVKTPLAMEAFLSTLHLTGGEATWYAKWIQGSIRTFFSLEIASFEGQVHFFIWTRANFRRIIESQLYAQYPGVQIIEAPDYTRLISARTEEWGVWGCDFVHTAADPLPIKTYVEYGLDKVQKEPEQVDPLANLIEYLASVGKGEYLWLQFIIRAHKGEKYKGKLNDKGNPFTWIDAGNEIIQEIRKATRESYIDVVSGEERPGFPNPTKGQMEKIAAIERNTSKLAFDVGGRGIYIARPDKFNPIAITHMIALFKPFNSEGWNGIRAKKWLMDFNDYPWEIGAAKLKETYCTELVQAFRRRQFFYDPFGFGVSGHDAMVLSTEELATIYHIPSRAVETPGLERIQSATGEAPANLPV
jgi:hypothetical protein